MLKNYLKIAWRNLRRNRASAIINIGGLAIGMAVAIQIGLWIYDELSFDSNFANYKRVARVIQNVSNNGEVQTWNSVPYPLAEELRKNYGSDFKKVVMAGGWSDHIIAYNDDKKLSKAGAYFEPGAPEMFSLSMIYGQWSSLSDPSTVLLSASAAKAFFGDSNPISKTLVIDKQLTVKMTGVYQDFPRNSSFANLDFIGTWQAFVNSNDWIKTMEDPWRPNAFALFVELNPGADFVSASAKIKDAKMKRVNPQLAKKKPAIFLHPMSNWHLYATFENGKITGGAIQYVWLFGITGLFVLLLACINFMNLSTARSEKRAKEVGIRKTMGSMRKQLILQFFSESLLTAILSFLLSIILVQFCLPVFNTLADKKMSIPWSNPQFLLLAAGFTIITGLVAGTYPSFYLSSFQPVKVLKGTFKAGRLAVIPRKVLVVIQFTVSVTLITGTMIVYRQIQFAKDRPIGYSREGLVTVPLLTPAVHEHFAALQKELEQTGAITGIAESGSPTTGIWNTSSGFSWREKDPNLSTDFGVIEASFDYGKTIQWELSDGRGFSRDFATDSSAVVLNEAAVHFMGFKHALGETISWWGKPYHVIGVVKNMITESPYTEVRPVVYTVLNEGGAVAIIRINPAMTASAAISKIAPVFRKFNPDQPFDYKFTDEAYAQKFGNEERVGKLAGFFALLAIFISCLGLFGLTAFVAEQRKKEIGVRKILGASAWNVWHLLSADFLRLVIISFLIAFPLSIFFMQQWLQHYHYRAALSWWIFVLAAAGAIGITIVTVSFQAIKAAVMNPARSLRTE